MQDECYIWGILNGIFCELRELIYRVFDNLLLKGVPLSIRSLGTEEDDNDLETELNQIDEKFANLST